MKIVFLSVFFAIMFFVSVAMAGVGIYLENDLGYGDRHYTHGTRLEYIPSTTPEWAKGVFPKNKVTMGISIAQYMYTPSDISISELIEDDRPYGGWAYMGLLFNGSKGNFLHLVEVDVGITGPPSLAEGTQKFVHKMISNLIPRGWENQIKTEPGLCLTYQRKYKKRCKYENNFDLDLIVHGGGAAGNIFSYMNGGGMLRTGFNVPDDFGYIKMEPSARIIKDFSWYVFVGTDIRWVHHNIFLDGNTYQDSHSVIKNPIVYDMNCGTGIKAWDLELIYSYTFRSKEFKLQDEPNVFRSLSIRWRY